MAKRYYLDEIEKRGDTSADDISDTDERQALWAEERAKYGFDGRDTWSLNMTMTEMIYERLKMYLVKADEIVNLSYYKFDYKGENYTQRELILKMIEDAEFYISFEYNAIPELNEYEYGSGTKAEDDENLDLFGEYEIKAHEAKQRLWEVWAIVQQHMWW